MPDVFISYNREDRSTARIVAGALEAEGFSVWWDAALRAGETYDEVTEKNLREAGAVVVLWSKRSASSKWVRAEATVGERSSTLVPALIEECDRPVRFELVQTADLTQWKGDRADPHWRALVQDIRAAGSRRAKVAEAPSGAARASDDVTIETTFWNSIKDGAERSDFEAYLGRYPNGHFASLAKNRIAALDRASASALKPAPQPAAAAKAPPPAPSKAPRAEVAQEKGGAGKVIMVAVVAVVILGLGVAAVFLTRNGTQPQEAAVISPPAAPVGEDQTKSANVAAAIGEPAALTEPASEALAAPDGAAPAVEIETGIADAQLADELAAAEAAAADGDALMSDVGPQESPAATAPPPAATASEPAVTPAGEKAKAIKPGKKFRDCDACPQMAALQGGKFLMGSPATETGRNAYEGPQHEVTVKPFAMSVYEVTVEEWAVCAADGACEAKRNSDGKLPVLGVSWREARDYAKWLSKKTGRAYRLPSEAEWEYAARAGAKTAYWWGESFKRAQVPSGAAKPVGSFEANAFGLHDVLGNAREWVEDCYVNNFAATPTDGSAAKSGDCARRVIRGGAWSSPPADMRAANRSRIDQAARPLYMGVRLAAEIKYRTRPL
ncbi:MAG: SUMF1/EgtB/PvdO family nonheme iron enzyme [Parvularculaceae bacterium]